MTMIENTSINPYAVSQPSAAFGPIRFCGTVTEQDILDSARPAPVNLTKQRWFGRLWTAGFFLYAAFVIPQRWMTAGVLSPFFWLLFASTLMFAAWLPVINYWVNSCGKAGERLQRMIARSRDGRSIRRGLLDQDGITTWTDGCGSRIRWSSYTAGEIWPDRIRFHDASDNRFCTLIPCLHFESAASFLDAQSHFQTNGATSIHEAPVADEVETLFRESTSNALPDFDVDVAKAWDKNCWPPDGRATSGETFEIHFANGLTWRSIAMNLATQLIVGGGIVLVPVLISGIGWLVFDYRYWEGWGFISVNVFENLLFVVPAVVFVIAVLYGILKSFVTNVRRVHQPMQFSVSPIGIHVETDELELWWEWSGVETAKEIKNSFVLQTFASIEPLQLCEKMFDSPATYRRFIDHCLRYRAV